MTTQSGGQHLANETLQVNKSSKYGLISSWFRFHENLGHYLYSTFIWHGKIVENRDGNKVLSMTVTRQLS